MTSGNAIQLATQLALFLDNKPGTLARVCQALAEAKINILAFSMSDTVDHTVLRMVVSDPRHALAVFEERGALAIENEVILFSGDNRPGSLARIAIQLSDGGVNIEYAYSATNPQARHGLLVMRVSNYKKAMKLLNSGTD